MEQAGEYLVQADRQTVWQALNDADVLARCIDGCQAMRKLNDEHFQAKVKARIGPVSAAFDLDLKLHDVQAPESYRIAGQVKGGPAGFGKGEAVVTLQEEGAATRLLYTVKATVGGKLAQVGSRLLDGAARKMADDFFGQFSAMVGTAEADGSDAATAAATSDTEVTTEPQREAANQTWFWLLAFGVLALALVLAL
ncbi:MAG: CoxG family protein [Pseudomonadales bacterium]